MTEQKHNRSPDKQSQRERIWELTEKLEEGVKAVFDSERYKEYLKCMSKFHNYSINNCLLIAAQYPAASAVAGYPCSFFFIRGNHEERPENIEGYELKQMHGIMRGPAFVQKKYPKLMFATEGLYHLMNGKFCGEAWLAKQNFYNGLEDAYTG